MRAGHLVLRPGRRALEPCAKVGAPSTLMSGFDTDGMLLAPLDWLLDRRIFNGLSRDAAYCEARLGFNAPNAFFLDLIR